jgi:hypothetical protein
MGLAWWIKKTYITPVRYFHFIPNRNLTPSDKPSFSEIEQLEQRLGNSTLNSAAELASLLEAQERQKDHIFSNMYAVLEQCSSKNIHVPPSEKLLPDEILDLAHRIVNIREKLLE